MNTAEIITAILGVGGIGYIIPKAVDGVKAWKSGKALREKAENHSLLKRLVSAETRADAEAAFRRQFEEYAGILRVLLVKLGFPQKELPEWPQRKETVKQ
jgi:hypothetical protein